MLSLNCSRIYLAIVCSSIIPALVAPITVPPIHAQTTETIIRVDPTAGNDETGIGTRENPLKTLTQALAIAPAEAVIQLAPGNYSEETGEKFPIVVEKPVTIRGKTQNRGYNVAIEGGGEFYSRTGAGQNVGIVLLADATLIGVSVTNQRDRGTGVWVEGASPTITQNTFQRNDNNGVSVNGTGKPVITDNYFFSNSGNGIVIYGKTQPLVKNNTFERTGFGISITEEALPTITDNEIKHNRIGVVIEGSSQPILRDNIIALSVEDGLVAIGNSRPNLGTANEPGGNIFRSNRGQDIKNLTKNYVIPASGNQITGETAGKLDLRGTATAQTPPTSPNRDLPPLLSLPPRETTAPPVSDNNASSVQEQVWTAPIGSASTPPPRTERPLPPLDTSRLLSPNSQPNPRTESPLPPLDTSRLLSPNSQPNPSDNNTAVTGNIQLSLPPRQNPPVNNPPPRSTPNPTSGRSLEELLVLEPNVSPSNPPSRRDFNVLPVPSNNIPTGNLFPPGTSPEERGRSVGGEYRVIVEITSASERSRVKEIVPEAFTSRYQGRAVMQVGIFSSEANAQEIRQRLQQAGLQVRVVAL